VVEVRRRKRDRHAIVVVVERFSRAVCFVGGVVVGVVDVDGGGWVWVVVFWGGWNDFRLSSVSCGGIVCMHMVEINYFSV